MGSLETPQSIAVGLGAILVDPSDLTWPSLMTRPSSVLISGDCSSVRTYNVLAHLFLNVIGTLVLGASNYLQQISTSPTAKQIERLQENINFGSDLPGELLKRKGWHMKLFWTLLISTSVPIHVILDGVLGIESRRNLTTLSAALVAAGQLPQLCRKYLFSKPLSSTIFYDRLNERCNANASSIRSAISSSSVPPSQGNTVSR